MIVMVMVRESHVLNDRCKRKWASERDISKVKCARERKREEEDVKDHTQVHREDQRRTEMSKKKKKKMAGDENKEAGCGDGGAGGGRG